MKKIIERVVVGDEAPRSFDLWIDTSSNGAQLKVNLGGTEWKVVKTDSGSSNDSN